MALGLIVCRFIHGEEPRIFLETERLLLRAWDVKSDFGVAKALHQDSEVIKTFLKPLSDEEVVQFMEDENRRVEKYNFGRFACVLKDTNDVIDFVGLYHP